MIELQLVGYTADLEYLVFCDAAEGASRFKAPVDHDLLATLTEVVDLSDPQQRRRLGPAPVVEPPPPPPPPAPPPPRAAPPPPRPAPPAASETGVGPLAAVALLLTQAPLAPAGGRAAELGANGNPGPVARGKSRLSPREIQAQLRAGKAAPTVAKQAGVDEAWVRRWLPPIEAERDRIINRARGARVVKSRLGPSAELLGAAVDRNLSAKRADPATVEWSATRRDGAPHWVVSVRYTSRGQTRRARWRFDPESGEVQPGDQHARDLAWTRAGGRRAKPAQAAAQPAQVAKPGKASKSAAKKPGAAKAKKAAPAKKVTPAKAKAAPKATSRKATAAPATRTKGAGSTDGE